MVSLSSILINGQKGSALARSDSDFLLWYSLFRLSVNQEEVPEGIALGQVFLTGDELNGSREMKRRRKNREDKTAASE